MEDSIQFLEEDLKTYRVGKANPSILNNVMVDYYGSQTPVPQVASVTVPDARTIAIQPWEKNMIGPIEKAIINANLGFTPQNNGEVIRCPIPPLTEERRKELIKKAKATGENIKVAVRNARRDGVDALKKAEKAGDFSEDVRKGKYTAQGMPKLIENYLRKQLRVPAHYIESMKHIQYLPRKGDCVGRMLFEGKGE